MKFFGCEDVDLAMKELRIPTYELPNLHRRFSSSFATGGWSFAAGKRTSIASPSGRRRIVACRFVPANIAAT